MPRSRSERFFVPCAIVLLSVFDAGAETAGADVYFFSVNAACLQVYFLPADRCDIRMAARIRLCIVFFTGETG